MRTTAEIVQGHVTACAFGALIAAGAFISIPLPITAVPIVLQNMLAVLAGLMLGPVLGFEAVALFVLAGALGAPVFAGGKGGIAHLFGPSGGYLVGYAMAALAGGFIAGKARSSLALHLLASFAAFVTIYLFGVPRLAMFPNVGIDKAIALGFLPFVLFDAIKAAAAGLISWKLVPVTRALLGSPRREHATR